MHVLEVLGRPLPVWAVSVYDSRARSAVHLLKYGGRRDLAGPLGELVAALVAAEAPRPGIVVPVPLHAARRRRRGYNQAGLLASVVARRLGCPDLPHALARVHATGPQAGSGASSRRLNVIGAFAAPRPDLVARRRVLLVDDVLTTGATAVACAAALFRAGAAAVDVAAFAAAGVTTKKRRENL